LCVLSTHLWLVLIDWVTQSTVPDSQSGELASFDGGSSGSTFNFNLFESGGAAGGPSFIFGIRRSNEPIFQANCVHHLHIASNFYLQNGKLALEIAQRGRGPGLFKNKIRSATGLCTKFTRNPSGLAARLPYHYLNVSVFLDTWL
jgi:hypothetical protein